MVNLFSELEWICLAEKCDLDCVTSGESKSPAEGLRKLLDNCPKKAGYDSRNKSQTWRDSKRICKKVFFWWKFRLSSRFLFLRRRRAKKEKIQKKHTPLKTNFYIPLLGFHGFQCFKRKICLPIERMWREILRQIWHTHVHFFQERMGRKTTRVKKNLEFVQWRSRLFRFYTHAPFDGLTQGDIQLRKNRGTLFSTPV